MSDVAITQGYGTINRPPVGYHWDNMYGGDIAPQNPMPNNVPLAWQEDPLAVYSTLGLGYKMPPFRIDYDTLYRMAKNDVVVQIVHDTIATIVCNFLTKPKSKYDIGFKIVHKTREEKDYSRVTRKEVARLTDWMLRCGVDDGDMVRDNLPTLGYKIVHDLLTYDQMCPEVILDRAGKPHHIRHIPAYTMRIVPSANPQSYISPEDQRKYLKYVQVDQHLRVVNGWTEERILWKTLRPRTTLFGYGYGESPLEILINTVSSHLFAEQWNSNIFRNGSSIPGILNLEGNTDLDKLASFRRQWVMQAQGVSNAHRLAIVNTEKLSWIPMNWSNDEMGFSDWLAYLMELICAMYRISPELLGLEVQKRAGGSGGKGGDKDARDHKVDGGKEKFLAPMLRGLASVFNSPKLLGALNPDFELVFQGVVPRDEEKDVELQQKRVQSIITVNEARAQENLPPLEGGDIPLNAVLAGHIAQQKALEQQEQMSVNPDAAGIGGQQTSEGRTAYSSIENTARTTGEDNSPQESLLSTEKSMYFQRIGSMLYKSQKSRIQAQWDVV